MLADTSSATTIEVLLGIKSAASLWTGGLLLLIGMLLITKGGDLFTDSSVAIARATRIPPVIVGATIVSMATTFPEFMVSVTGVLAGFADFAVGNALGSCVCNIGLIVGSCVLLKGVLAKRRNEEPGIPTSRETLIGAGSFMLLAGIALWIFSYSSSGRTLEPDGTPAQFAIVRWEGALLIVLLAAYVAHSLRLALTARFEAELVEDEEPANQTPQAMVFGFFIGALLVVLGSRLLVSNAESIALQLGVPRLIVGLTVLAIGTSLPEYTISLLAVIKGHGALGMGNIIGANVLNICWVVASCALIKPLPIRSQTVFLDAPVVLLLMALLLILPWNHERFSSRSGAILLGVYAAYLIGMFAFFGG